MLKTHFRMFADYNRWANRLLYDAAGEVSDADYHADSGAFFGSLSATLNHLLVTDRVWLHRFTGKGDAPTALDAILFKDLTALTSARRAEDERIIAWIETLDEAALAAMVTYTPISRPVEITQQLAPLVSHLFNHQTHHRGQCHMILTRLRQPSLALDLSFFLRAEGARWMEPEAADITL